jgi:hypothetical protein
VLNALMAEVRIPVKTNKSFQFKTSQAFSFNGGQLFRSAVVH